MRILQLTKKFPYPLNDGESWAVIGLAKGLQQSGAITDLYSLNTQQHFADDHDKDTLRALDLYHTIFTKEVVARANSIGALSNLFSNNSYHAVRFYRKDILQDLLAVVSQNKYEFILIEGAYLSPYGRDIKSVYPNVKIVLRAHNVEYMIWQRYSQRRLWPIKWYYQNQSNRIRTFESQVLEFCDAVISVSDADRITMSQSLGLISPYMVAHIPMTPLEDTEREIENRPVVVGYIGSLDWRPNREGLDWFVKHVWANMCHQENDMMLMIAGRNPDKSQKYHQVQNVNFLGEVEDSDIFMKRIDILIVPLLSGSGTRVKVLQALSVGTPIIGSSLAFEGLAVEHRSEVLIAETPKSWEEDLIALAGDIELQKSLIKAGYKYLLKNHDPDQIGRQVTDFLEAL